jgi:hypothetical protein
VSTAGPGNLTFASKALRCDFSYCAEEALTDGLAGSDGIIRTVFSENPEGDRQLTVDFDATAISDDDVVIAVRQLLEGLDDPVYDLPIEIEFRAN